jgi:hypothetical protein
MLGSIPARRAERFARQRAASRSAPPGDYTPPSRPLAGQRRRTGTAYRYPVTHPPPHSSRRPDRWREQASAPERLVGPRTQPWTAWWASREPRPCLAGHARSPSERPLPPGCGRRTPGLDTVSADQFLMRTPGSGWPGDGHGGPLDRPVGRRSPVQGDRPADGYRTRSGRRRPSSGHLHRPASDHAPGQPATANHAARSSWP